MVPETWFGLEATDLGTCPIKYYFSLSGTGPCDQITKSTNKKIGLSSRLVPSCKRFKELVPSTNWGWGGGGDYEDHFSEKQ